MHVTILDIVYILMSTVTHECIANILALSTTLRLPSARTVVRCNNNAT